MTAISGNLRGRSYTYYKRDIFMLPQSDHCPRLVTFDLFKDGLRNTTKRPQGITL